MRNSYAEWKLVDLASNDKISALKTVGKCDNVTPAIFTSRSDFPPINLQALSNSL